MVSPLSVRLKFPIAWSEHYVYISDDVTCNAMKSCNTRLPQFIYKNSPTDDINSTKPFPIPLACALWNLINYLEDGIK